MGFMGFNWVICGWDSLAFHLILRFLYLIILELKGTCCMTKIMWNINLISIKVLLL